MEEPYIRDFTHTKPHPSLAMANPLDEILAHSRRKILSYELKLPYSQKQETAPGTKDNQQESAAPTATQSKIFPKAQLAADVTSTSPSSIELQTSLFLKEPQNLTQLQKEQIGRDSNDNENDPLACHANLIVRMAMDTTMMGSFCNSSISLNFLNLVDESMGKLEDGNERSRTEFKKGNLLNFQRAARVEISAADLEEAINNPIK